MTTTIATPQTTPLGELIDLTGRSAIVTGGAMGIGLGIARRLHEAGASVLVADLDLAASEHAAEALRAVRADSALTVRCDVSDPESVEGMVHTVVESFGGVDILVNNAGIFPMLPLKDLDVETFRRVLDVNPYRPVPVHEGRLGAHDRAGQGRADRQRHIDRRAAPVDGRAGPLRRVQARRLGLHQEHRAGARLQPRLVDRDPRVGDSLAVAAEVRQRLAERDPLGGAAAG